MAAKFVPFVMRLAHDCAPLVGNRATLRRCYAFAITLGVIDGLAMISLLPTATSLATGDTVWGLSFGVWLTLTAILAIIAAVVTYSSELSSYSMAITMLATLLARIGDQIASVPLGWFRSTTAGRIGRMVSTSLMTVGQLVAHFLGTFYAHITTLLVLTLGALAWDLRLGLILVFSIPVIYLVLLLQAQLHRAAAERIQPDENALANRIIEYARCQPALRATGRSRSYEPLAEARRTVGQSLLRGLWFDSVGIVISGIVSQGIVVVTIILAARGLTDSVSSPVATIAFIALALRFEQLVAAISTVAISVEETHAPLAAVLEVLDAEPLPEPAQPATLTRPGEIECRQVTFGYRPETPVLRDVSLTIPAGSMCAIVGPSGCGKTTLARLLCRFYDTTSGEVLVGGVSVRKQTLEQLMAQLSMVFQDVYLFDDTVAANIRLGNPDASDDDVIAAARLAGVESMVERLPGGWNARVGEGGRILSGGERQRVSVARALLKKAPIVILDEATSALDPENESHIVASVDALRDHATVIVIAHKLDTIRTADMIVSLTDDGHVEAVGTHDELMALDGTYARFIHTREAASGWQLTSAAHD